MIISILAEEIREMKSEGRETWRSGIYLIGPGEERGVNVRPGLFG